MKVTVDISLEQMMLVEEHLLNGKKLFVALSERQRLVEWVKRHHPGHRIGSAEMDLENGRWSLELQPVTVTS